MKITYYNHASMCVRSKTGFEILTDPWIYGPIYAGSMWQFPTCKIDLKRYYKKDALYISHTHPDHFCLNTLKGFSKNIPIYIRKYGKNVPMKKILNRNGFKNVFEVDHREKIKIADDFHITLVHDKNTVDSLIICENNKKTFLMQNDCFLSDDEYKWINRNFNIDLAGIFFMGIGPMPGAFNFPWSDKERIVAQKKKDNFLRSEKTVKLLNAKKVFPCSNDMIWYRRPDLASLNGALSKDFKKHMDKKYKGKTLLIQSKDTYDLQNNKIQIKNKQDIYNDKKDQLKEYYNIYYNKKMLKHKDELNKWEDKFKFDSSKFHKLFNKYLKSYVSQHDLNRINKNLLWCLIPIAALLFNPIQYTALLWAFGSMDWFIPIFGLIGVVYLLNKTRVGAISFIFALSKINTSWLSIFTLKLLISKFSNEINELNISE